MIRNHNNNGGNCSERPGSLIPAHVVGVMFRLPALAGVVLLLLLLKLLLLQHGCCLLSLCCQLLLQGGLLQACDAG